jgi:glycerophosphoryl diester phosphodiesterase
MILPTGFLTRPIAHRAYHDRALRRPENSLAAVRAAVDSNYAIEIDLQLSADGVPMVFHDEILDRLTDSTGPLAHHTAASLGEILIRDGAEGIPTLTQVLDIVAGRVPLLIEIKDQDGMLGPNIGALEAATAEVVAGYTGPLALMSFNPHSIAALAQLAPHIPRGLTTSAYDPADWAPVSAIVCDRLRDIPDYDRTGACFISHEASDLGRPRVAELRAQGAAVLCWTIRSAQAAAAARQIADNVTFEGYAA